MFQRDLRVAAKSVYVRSYINPIQTQTDFSVFLHSGLKFDSTGMYVQLHVVQKRILTFRSTARAGEIPNSHFRALRRRYLILSAYRGLTLRYAIRMPETLIICTPNCFPRASICYVDILLCVCFEYFAMDTFPLPLPRNCLTIRHVKA